MRVSFPFLKCSLNTTQLSSQLSQSTEAINIEKMIIKKFGFQVTLLVLILNREKKIPTSI